MTVYEEESVAGGMLSYAIPEYRLPKAILQKEIDVLKQAGVKIKLNTKIGEYVTFDDLKSNHDSIYIATGTQISKKIGIEGEDKDGVYHGLDFLKDVHLGKLKVLSFTKLFTIFVPYTLASYFLSIQTVL